MKHIIVEEVEIQIYLVETEHSWCQMLPLSYLLEQFITYTRSETQMYTTVLDRLLLHINGLFTEVIQKMIDGFFCRWNEVYCISLREPLPADFKSFNMIKISLIHVEELATRGKNSQSSTIQHHNHVVFAMCMSSSRFLNHVIEDSVLSVAS